MLKIFNKYKLEVIKMYKKVIGVLLCLVFLLSISCVVANENISGYSSLPDDIEVTDENSEINDVEINDD